MGKLILFNMMTIDGFFEGKNREIDWHNVDSEFNDFAVEQLNSADTLIFGRITYDLMAGYWPTEQGINDDTKVTEKMNSLKKVVFSKTLEKADWINTELVMDNIEETIKELKQKTDKNIFIFGSANLASTLRKLNLIDEYRLMVNPIILGQGRPLFNLPDKQGKLNLLETRVFNSGNVLLCYNPK